MAAGGGGVTIQLVPPIQFILRQTGAFQRALFDFSGLFEAFKPVMAEIEQEQFSSHGHGAWPELAESTLRYKKGDGILRETNTLYDSLVDPNVAMRVGARSAEYGTSVDYAHWHQTGGTTPGRPPQRQVIPDPLPAGMRQRLEVVMIRWINEIAARTVGRI